MQLVNKYGEMFGPNSNPINANLKEGIVLNFTTAQNKQTK